MSCSRPNHQQYLEDQYRNASNLNARLHLHRRFSTNKYGWHRWVFDELDLPARCRILELGCGPGDLWLENLTRIPEGWEIILSDFSVGMLQQAEQNLSGHRHFQFEVVDAQSTPLPFQSEHFDAVIANHMLSHVSDKPAVFSEVRRILKPRGHFYAATNGSRHLSEVVELIGRFDVTLGSRWESEGCVGEPFSLENGAAQLSQWFGEVTRHRYEDGLDVTEGVPLMDYIMSGWMSLEGDRLNQFGQFLEREMELCGGSIHITKDPGIFVSVRDNDLDL